MKQTKLEKDKLAAIEQTIIEDRQTLLSVLLELTVAASNLVDPASPIALFLERLAERLGCTAALFLEVTKSDKKEVRLVESIGLSGTSRNIPLVNLESIASSIGSPIGSNDDQNMDHGELAAPAALPYLELLNPNLVRWSFPICIGGSEANPEVMYYLQLYFDGHQVPKKQYYGLCKRLLLTLKNALAHRRLYRSTLEQNALLEAQSECTMEGILMVSVDHKVRFINQRFVDMWGFKPRINTFLGKADVIPLVDKVKNPFELFSELDSLEDNRERRTQTEVYLKDGLILECLSVPIEDQNKVYYGRGWYFRDITENKRAQRERALLLKREIKARSVAEVERKKIEKALGTRDDFISIASHELRTPITSLRLQLQLMQKMLLSTSPIELHSGTILQRLIRMATLSEQQVERLTQLIFGLLDVSRIQAGKLSLEPQQVNLSELLLEVVSRFNEQFAATRIEVSLNIESEIVGYWDPVRVEQVINNLIVNAMKYGTGKPIEVSLTRSHDSARMAVRDYGIGIRKDQQKQIFKKYERVSSSANITGLGLGLYIVRQIVKHHRGSISVHSSPGQGATFIVHLPLDLAKDSRLSA